MINKSKIGDIWIFIQYHLDSIRPKKIISLQSGMIFLFLTAIYVVFDKGIIYELKALFLSLIIILFLFFRAIVSYNSGIHRHWWRTEHNIPNIKKIKEEYQNAQNIQTGNNNE